MSFARPRRTRKIKVGDLSAARGAPGVHLVWTAADIRRPRPHALARARAFDRTNSSRRRYPVLCGDIVRHVGDAIAFIVADDIESAKSAAELIDVDYDTLPVVADTAAALEPRTRRWSGRTAAPTSPSPITAGEKAATEAAFAKAAKIARSRRSSTTASSATTWSRAPSSPNTTRRGPLRPDVGSQGVHGMRDALCKVLKIDPQTDARA